MMFVLSDCGSSRTRATSRFTAVNPDVAVFRVSRAAVLLTVVWLILANGIACGSANAAPADAPRASQLTRTNLLVRGAGSTAGKPGLIRSPRQWRSARPELLNRMEQVMGPMPGLGKRCPLDLRIESEEQLEGFVRQRISYASEPGGRVPAWLLIPNGARGSRRGFPAILALHQTHPMGAKVVVGLGNSPDDEYGVELARRGYVCLAPSYPHLAEYAPDLRGLGWESGTLKAVWDNRRGLDLLQSLPFVRKDRIGALGHSLGGHNALYTAAFDERIRVVATSCGFDSFQDYYDGNPAVWKQGAGWTQDRYMPRLARYQGRLGEIPFDFTDVLAAVAPRPCFVNAPLGDSNFRWRSVDAIVAEVAPVYALLGRPENLVVRHPDSPHRFPAELREEVYAMFDRHLK